MYISMLENIKIRNGLKKGVNTSVKIYRSIVIVEIKKIPVPDFSGTGIWWLESFI